MNTEELTKEQIEKTKKYSIVDGSAYNVMYGFGEQYVVPYAIKLGATNTDIAIISSAPPFVSSLFQIISAKLAEHLRNRKKVIILFVLFQALMIIPLFIVPFYTKNILMLTIIFFFYTIFGNMVGPPWASLIGDVIEKNDYANYFSKRNKIINAVMVISILIAGSILHFFAEINNVWMGFGVLFSIAFIGRIVSLISLIHHYEPTYIINNINSYSFRNFLISIPKTDFGRYALFRSFVSFAVMIAAPFFAIYMLKQLNFSYIQYTAIILIPMIFKVLTSAYWGKYATRYGNRNIMYISILVVSLIPLLWFLSGYLFEGKEAIFFAILFTEAISGFGWAGFELTTFIYALETVKSEERIKSFTYYNIVWYTGILLGGISGLFLLKYIPTVIFGIKSMLIVFLASSVARFGVAFLFMPKIKEVKVLEGLKESKIFFKVVIERPINITVHHTQLLFLEIINRIKNMPNNFIKNVEDFKKKVNGKEKNKP